LPGGDDDRLRYLLARGGFVVDLVRRQTILHDQPVDAGLDEAAADHCLDEGSVKTHVYEWQGILSTPLPDIHILKPKQTLFKIKHSQVKIQQVTKPHYCSTERQIHTVKAPNFGPHGNFGPLFQKGLLPLKRVLQRNKENKRFRKYFDLHIRFCSFFCT
jgi:hypothetical protein